MSFLRRVDKLDLTKFKESNTMKKVYLLLFIYMLSLKLNAQDGYLNLVTNEHDNLYNSSIFEFDDRILFTGYDFESTDSFPTKNSFIGEVMLDGTITKLKIFKDILFTGSPVHVEDNELIIIGDLDDDLCLLTFDLDLNTIDSIVYEMGELFSLNNHDIHSYKNHYVISTDHQTAWDTIIGKVFWINKNSLNIDTSFTYDQHLSTSYIDDITSDNDNLYVLVDQDFQPVNYLPNLFVYNEQMELVHSMTLTDNFSFRTHNLLADNQRLFYSGFRAMTIASDKNGNLEWVFDIEDVIVEEISEYPRIVKMKFSADDHLLISGYYYRINPETSNYEHFIYNAKLSKDGELLWHHKYPLNPKFDHFERASLNDFLETSDSIYWVGQHNNGPWELGGNPQYHVVLKTDKEGCYSDNCDFLDTSNTLEIETVNSGLFKVVNYNSLSKLNIEIQPNINARQLEVYNVMGQLILRLNNLSDTVEINLNGHSSGTYIIRLISDTNKMQLERIIHAK